MSVCPLTYLINDMSRLHKIFCTLLVPVAQCFSDDNALRYVLNGFVNHVMLAHNGPYGTWLRGHIVEVLTRGQHGFANAANRPIALLRVT